VHERTGNEADISPVVLRWVHKDSGEVRWFETRYVSVRDESGERVAVEGIARDVTDRRRAEDDQMRLGQALALLAERERIAMELHDGAIQMLYGSVLRLGALARPLPEDSSLRAPIADLVGQLNGVIVDLRGYVQGLTRGQAEAGLRAGLAGLVAEYGCDKPRLVLNARGWQGELETRLELDTVGHVLQVAREAVSNAVRHARAEQITLAVRRRGDRLVVEVADDGVGLPSPADRGASGHGLRNMAERARRVGGSLAVGPGRRGGTVVRLELPLG
jgi:signal transduction histidine kinase